MKYKTSFKIAFLWVALALMLGILLFFYAPKKDRASETENRMLQGFPSLSPANVFSGAFSEQFESFLSDGFFVRDAVVDFTRSVSDTFSVMDEDDRYTLDDAEEQVAMLGIEEDEAARSDADMFRLETGGSTEEEQIETAADTSPQIGEVTGIGSEYLQQADTFHFYLKRCDGGKTEIYSYPLKNVQTVSETLNKWAEALPEGGGLYYAIIPFAATGNRWTQNTDTYCGWASNAEDAIAALTDGRVHVFNAPAILEGPMSEGETLFFRTDHHWTPRGAYHVAMAMIASQGYPVTPFDEYAYKVALTAKSVDGGYRDTLEIMYPLLPVESQIIKHRTEVSTINFMAYDNPSYQAFLCSTQFPWRKLVTGFHTGKKALVVCDSFGNVFAPYLMPYYDEVHMVDIRNEYIDTSLLGAPVRDLIAQHEIDDVYILYSTANGLNADNSLVYLRKYFEGK